MTDLRTDEALENAGIQPILTTLEGVERARARALHFYDAEIRRMRKALWQAREEKNKDLAHARSVAARLLNSYSWDDEKSLEDPITAPLYEKGEEEGSSYQNGTAIWMGGELACSIEDYEGDQGEDLAEAIAKAGRIILTLAAEVERLRETKS